MGASVLLKNAEFETQNKSHSPFFSVTCVDLGSVLEVELSAVGGSLGV